MLDEPAAIAHEVSQPLTSILSNGIFSLRQIESASPDLTKIRDAVHDIVNDARRAISIISQVRALAQRDSSEQVPLSLNEVIRDVIAFLHQPLERSRVSITVDLSAAVSASRSICEKIYLSYRDILYNCSRRLRMFS